MWGREGLMRTHRTEVDSSTDPAFAPRINLMSGQQQDERNHDAYRRLKETIKRTYPPGWFIGIADDQVVGAAADFGDLERMLRAQGKDPRGVLVVEADVDYPESATIFGSGLRP